MVMTAAEGDGGFTMLDGGGIDRFVVAHARKQTQTAKRSRALEVRVGLVEVSRHPFSITPLFTFVTVGNWISAIAGRNQRGGGL